MGCGCGYYPSPRWSFQIFHSKMPMSFDQYDHCAFNCLYCFSFFQKSLKAVNPMFVNKVNTNYQGEKPVSVKIESIKKIFLEHTQDVTLGQFYEYVQRKYPLQWGCLSDPFCNFEKRYGVGLEILKILDSVSYPISFSTKGTWWLDDPRYMKLFKKNKDIWRVQFSITTNSDELSKMIELGVPSPSERIEAMRRYYKETGKSTTLRLRPFIIGYSDQNDNYVDLINRAASYGKCFRLSTEFFCMETRFAPGVKERYEKIGNVTGLDLINYYKTNSQGVGYLKLNWKLKKKYIDRMSECCRKNNIAFYVSDAMMKDQSHDYRNNNTPDGDWKAKHYPGQFSDAIQIAMKSKNCEVHWSDISEAIYACLGGFLWRHAMNYNTGGSEERSKRYNITMAEYIHNIWNDPNNHHSPYKYFHGILTPVSVDSEKNVVYKYTPQGRVNESSSNKHESIRKRKPT